MTPLPPLPEGCELTLSIYATSDETGLNMVVNLKGMKTYIDQHIDAPAMLKGFPSGEVSDWRVMTRAEIIQYKADEESDQ